MFDEKFLQDVRDEQFHFFDKNIKLDYTWYQFLKLLKTHPDKITSFNDEAMRFSLTALQHRAMIPRFAKNILSELRNTFPQNTISLIAFGGLDMDHRSFKVHRDGMDVLYVQVLGNIDWSIWEAYEDTDAFYPHHTWEGKQIHKQTMIAGDAVWIPRGTHHHVHPLSGRVGFSFGVEGQPNPSTYI